MIRVLFPKESKYVKFFERVGDVNGNLILKPYEFNYESQMFRTDKYFCLEILEVNNDEFESTLGVFIKDLIEKYNTRSWSRCLQRCINAIRWMDPVLSEFKQTPYGYGLEIEIQLGKIKELKKWGSSYETGEIKLSFKRLRTKELTLITFIHELIHIVQYWEGYNMHDPTIEDEDFMLAVAKEHLSQTTIPDLWASLIHKRQKRSV
ncbi:MAG: hypothetical protein QXN36_08660 [Candidatus Bathyarchaeia archaeon]